MAPRNSSRAVGVFDSGVGGLTVLRAIRERLPREHLVYFGDTAHLPYGTKSPATVTRLSLANAAFLMRRGIKFLVIACNTASAVALARLRQRLPVPVLGVIGPGVRAALARSHGGRIGVAATRTTVTSGAYQRALRSSGAGARVFAQACPLFVPLAEEGWTRHAVTFRTAREYLAPLKKARVDTVILGCTHYPLLRAPIAAALGRSVRLVDSGREVAEELARQLEKSGLLRKNGGRGHESFFLTDTGGSFRPVAERFLGRPIGRIVKVAISALLIVSAGLWGGTARADAGTWLLQFASSPSRYIGTPGHRATVDAVAEAFRSFGLRNVKREPVKIVAPVEGEMWIEGPGVGRANLHMVWPNHAQLSTTPRSGLVGTLVDAGNGEASAMNGAPVEGCIALVRLPCAGGRLGWLTPFTLGAAAVIFIPPSDGSLSRAEAEDLFLSVPTDLPRFWAAAGSAGPLLDAAKARPKVRLVAHAAWKEITVENIWGVIPGSPDRFPSADKESKAAWKDKAVIIQAYTDSMSVVPALAPGGEEAGGLSALMELAAHFSANRVPPTLIFLATSGHDHALSGVHDWFARHLRRDQYFTKSITGEEKVDAQLMVGLDLSSGDPHVAAFAQSTFYNGWENDLLAQNAMAGMARQLDAYARKLWGSGASGRYLNGVSPPTRTWKDMMGYQTAYDADGAQLLGTRALTFASPFDARLRVDTPFDTAAKVDQASLLRQVETIRALLSSAFVDPQFFEESKMEMPDIGRAFGGEVHEFERTVTGLPNKPVSGVLMTVWAGPCGAAIKPKTYGPVRGLQTWFTERDNPKTFSATETGTFRLPVLKLKEYWQWIFFPLRGFGFNGDGKIEMTSDTASITAVQFQPDVGFQEREKRTLHVLFRCVPFSILEPVDARYLRFLDTITVMDGFDQPFMNQGEHIVGGQSMAQESFTPAVVIFAPVMKKSSTWDLERDGRRMVLTVTFTGVPEENESLEDWLGISARGTGTLGSIGDKTKPVVFISSVRPGSMAGEARIRVGDGLLKVDGRPVLGIKSFRSIFGSIKGVLNVHVKALLSTGPFGLKGLFIGADEGLLDAADEKIPEDKRVRITPVQSQGTGYPAAMGLLRRAPYEGAKDMWILDEGRGRLLREHNVRSFRIEELHRQAGEGLLVARAAWKDRKFDAFLSAARSAWGLEARAYPEFKSVANDLVQTVVFYCLLLLPFAYCLERLLFAFADLRRQLVAASVLFVLGFLALRQVHPAFRISSNPIIIFLGFIVLVLGIIVLGIIISKFQRELRRLKGERGDYESVDIGRVSATVAALTLGLSNLRKRPVRTGLTVTTVVMLTFTVLSMVSMSSTIQFFRLPRGANPPYAGALVRDVQWQVLQPPVEEYMKSAMAGSAELLPRSWVVSRSSSEALQLEVTGPSGQTGIVQALLGMAPREAAILKPAKNAGLQGRWFTTRDRYACILPAALASRIGAGPGSTVRIRGTELAVVGTFEGPALEKCRDLDGESMTPAKFSAKRGRYDWEESTDMKATDKVAENFRPADHLAGNAVVIVPNELALEMEGHLRSVAVIPLKGTSTSVMVDSVKEFLKRAAVMALVSDGKNTQLLTSIGAVSVKGALSLLIPLALACLIVLNTMMGSVHERVREISIFSSVGLAPTHIGALFVAEAFVVAIVGVVLGYLMAQFVSTLLMNAGMLKGLSLNYSSSAAVGACIIVMGAVMISTIYPARRASDLAVPDVTRRWKLPKPEGDLLEFDFPFTVGSTDLLGMFMYLAELFKAFRDSSIGSFATDRVRLSRTKEGVAIDMSCWLAPYDLGISQRVKFEAIPMEVKGLYRIQVTLERRSGEADSWYRQNRRFLTTLRKRFLVWRMFGRELKARYEARGNELLKEGKRG